MINRRNMAVILLGILTTTAAESAAARSLIATSGASHVELVELYTSEGCSSCPPADKWVSDLKDRSDLWKHFVPVAFHVDYWNNSSWSDGLSSDAMTQRQTDLSHLWREPSVYTPALVLDGKEWRDWHQNQAPSPSPANPQKITLSLFKETDGSFTVRVEKPKTASHLVVKVAELGMGLNSHVTGGENSGRVLTHNFAVLDWEGKALGANQNEQNFKFQPSHQKVSQTAIAAWVEEEGNPTPLQAVGGYL
jgi:hypothetical protein